MASTSGSVSLDSMIWAKIDQRVEEGDFESRSEAIETLCTTEDTIDYGE